MRKIEVRVIILFAFIMPFFSCSNPVSGGEGNHGTEYTTAPSVISTTPANNAIGVDTNTSFLTIAFDQDMKPQQSFAINQSGLLAASPVQWPNPRTIKIFFGRPLSPGFNYRFTLNWTGSSYPPFKNTSGIELAADTVVNFTISPYATAPQIISALFSNGSAAEGATGIPSGISYLEVKFDQDMRTGYSVGSNDPNLTVINAAWLDLRTCRIGFPSALTPNYAYSLYLNHASYTNFKNTSGLALPDSTITFATGD